MLLHSNSVSLVRSRILNLYNVASVVLIILLVIRFWLLLGVLIIWCKHFIDESFSLKHWDTTADFWLMVQRPRLFAVSLLLLLLLQLLALLLDLQHLLRQSWRNGRFIWLLNERRLQCHLLKFLIEALSIRLLAWLDPVELGAITTTGRQVFQHSFVISLLEVATSVHCGVGSLTELGESVFIASSMVGLTCVAAIATTHAEGESAIAGLWAHKYTTLKCY